MVLKHHYQSIILLLILFFSAYFRFTNLMWGASYFFDPDERNMATAITNVKLPTNLLYLTTCFELSNQKPKTNDQGQICSLNPNFFAYGHFPIYLSIAFERITSCGWSFFNCTQTTVPFERAIYWLRILSAVASTLTIPLVFLITQQIVGLKNTIGNWKLEIGHYAALLTAFTPGLIQAAHMGTTESLLTFFFMFIIYLSLVILSLKKSSGNPAISYLLLAICLGVALGTKLSAGVFIVPIGAAFIFKWLTESAVIAKTRKPLWTKIAAVTSNASGYLSLIIMIGAGSILIALLTSPFFIIAINDALGITNYEINVARGVLPVFYTRQFIDTIPILFQAEKIFPYALGWPLFILGSIGIFLTCLLGILSFILSVVKKKFVILLSVNCYLLIVAFGAYFLPNAFLFTKWTRFMTPIFPLFSVFAVLLIERTNSFLKSTSNHQETRDNDQTIIKLKAPNRKLFYNWNLVIGFCLSLVSCVLVILAILPGLAFFATYTREDVRLTASKWIYENIPSGSHVLSETGNVIDIPLFLSKNQPIASIQVVSFDFYHLDENNKLQVDLINQLVESDYIFIPSRRLFANSMRLPQNFPILYRYYETLFSGQLGFAEVTKFTSYPKLETHNWKLETADEEAEETWTVFDHPVIRIYKKTQKLTKEDYEKILEI